jgi:CheY-like chemotaxis protein
MPEISGDRLARKFMEIKPAIPIILCTGFSASIDKERATAMGIRAFVNKPILRRQLIETVRAVLDG